MKAIGESCGRTLAQVKAEYKKIGDLGEVAFNSRTRQKTLFKSKPLTVRGVFDELKKVAKTSGKDVSRRFFLSLSISLSRASIARFGPTHAQGWVSEITQESDKTNPAPNIAL